MRIQPEQNSVNIVLIGSFNPAIFQPAWFVVNNMISKEDLDSSETKVEIIHPGIAKFKVGDWLNITVMQEQFIAETNEPPFIRLSDLVAKIFGEILIHTPVIQMGINRMVHFNVGSEENRNKIGKMLAPQELWGEWAKDIEGKNPKKRGGMFAIVMRQVDLDDREKGHIQAEVKPSPLIPNGAGIFVGINDHYEIPNDDSLDSAIRMARILGKKFDDSLQKSEWIIDQIMALKEKL
jgi:hypothetical protein